MEQLRAELRAMHDRLVAVESDTTQLKENTTEIVEWVRNGRLSAKIAARVFGAIGKAAVWIVKMLSTIGVLYAVVEAIRNGKVPSMSYFFWRGN